MNIFYSFKVSKIFILFFVAQFLVIFRSLNSQNHNQHIAENIPQYEYQKIIVSLETKSDEILPHEQLILLSCYLRLNDVPTYRQNTLYFNKAEKIIANYYKYFQANDTINILQAKWHRLKRNYQKAFTIINDIQGYSSFTIDFPFCNFWYEKAQVEQGLNRCDDAVESYKNALSNPLYDRWAAIELAKLYFRIDKDSDGCAMFYYGLEGMKDSNRVEELFDDIYRLTSSKDNLTLETKKTKSERLSYIKTFWLRHDPDWTDTLNQILVQFYVKKLFTVADYLEHTRIMKKVIAQKKSWPFRENKFYIHQTDDLFVAGDKKTKKYFTYKPSTTFIPINANFSCFRTDSQYTRLDFYYAVPFNQIDFIKEGKYNKKASLNIKMVFYDSSYHADDRLDNTITIQINDKNKNELALIEERRFFLLPGIYDVGLSIDDGVNRGVFKFRVLVPSFDFEALSISDIQPAITIDQDETNSKYRKPYSKVNVLPNPAFLVISTSPLFAYYEVYNLCLDNNGFSHYEINYTLRMVHVGKSILNFLKNKDLDNNAFSISSSTVRKIENRTDRDFMGLDISSLPTGEGVLEISVKDLNSNHVCHSSMYINIFRK